jgi:tight adherence protein B
VEAEALDLLDGLAPALRAGLPPVTALQLVTSSRPRASPGALGWAGLEAAASRGDSLAPAWSAYAAAIASDDLRLVAAAWSLCETLGSPLAPTVATVAAVVRSRRAVRHRIAAALAGPQATMRVLTALPLSGPLIAVAVGVAPSELYAGAAGLSSLVVGLTLLLAGRAWASRMVRAVTLEPHPRTVTLESDPPTARRRGEASDAGG